MTAPLPPYSVKVSPRARRVRLTLSREHGLVVTVPRGFDTRLVPSLLETRAEWIRQAAKKIERLPPPPPVRLPDELVLPLLGERWRVSYLPEAGKRLRLEEDDGGRRLVVRGPLGSQAAVLRLLKAWLRGKAALALPARLEQVSRRLGLAYNGVTIRDQRTRWGSCSSAGNINLNLKLLLLPTQLVDYVLTHELCHTRVLSHSASFWKLVASHYPDYPAARRALLQAGKSLPL